MSKDFISRAESAIDVAVRYPVDAADDWHIFYNLVKESIPVIESLTKEVEELRKRVEFAEWYLPE